MRFMTSVDILALPSPLLRINIQQLCIAWRTTATNNRLDKPPRTDISSMGATANGGLCLLFRTLYDAVSRYYVLFKVGAFPRVLARTDFSVSDCATLSVGSSCQY